MPQQPAHRRLLPIVGLVAAALVAPNTASSAPAEAATTQLTTGASWTRVFADEFTGGSLNAQKWSKFTGGQRRASNVIVHNGMLTLRTRRSGSGWTSAGVTNGRALKTTYGRYEIRARLQRGYGTRAVALLWPVGGGWPPETDFFEAAGNDPGRTKNYLTNHYVGTTRRDSMQHSLVTADFTRWQTIGVIWDRTAVRYQLNGRTVATQTGHVSSQRMWMGLQTSAGLTGSARPNSGTPDSVDFDVDWVRIYKRTS